MANTSPIYILSENRLSVGEFNLWYIAPIAWMLLFRQVWLVFFQSVFWGQQKGLALHKNNSIFHLKILLHYDPVLNDFCKQSDPIKLKYNAKRQWLFHCRPLCSHPSDGAEILFALSVQRHLPTNIISKNRFQINVNDVKSQGSAIALPFVYFFSYCFPLPHTKNWWRKSAYYEGIRILPGACFVCPE